MKYENTMINIKQTFFGMKQTKEKSKYSHINNQNLCKINFEIRKSVLNEFVFIIIILKLHCFCNN